MKKILLSLVFLCIVLTGASAYYDQKYYSVTDDIFVRADRLCRMTGNLGPVPVAPATSMEIKRALNRIDYETLSTSLKAEYDAIVRDMEAPLHYAYVKDNNILDISVKTALEFYGFNHTEDTTTDEFFIPYRDRESFLDTAIEVGIMDNVYLNFDYPIRDDNKGYEIEDGKVLLGDYFYDFYNFSWLISPRFGGGWDGMLASTPGKAKHDMLSFSPLSLGMSIGNSFMNFMMGRMHQSFGSGITGNMIIGDNFSYQEMMRYSFHSDIISYYMTLTHYDNIEEMKPIMLNGMHQNRSIQRIDFNILNKLRFAINIGAQASMENPFDWRLFTPFMILHNWNDYYERPTLHEGDEINNILGVEVEFTPYRGLFASWQFVLDQGRTPVETTSVLPDAWGTMLTMKYIADTATGTVDSWIEFLYTNPYLYLNWKRTYDEATETYIPFFGLDHMGGYLYNKEYVSDPRYGYGGQELQYFGHIMGPDTIAFSMGADYASTFGLDLKGEILYRIQGENGRLRGLTNFKDEETIDKLQIHHNDFRNSPTGIPEHMLSFEIDADYELTDNLSFRAGINASFYWNYHNTENLDRQTIQAAVGMSYIII